MIEWFAFPLSQHQIYACLYKKCELIKHDQKNLQKGNSSVMLTMTT